MLSVEDPGGLPESVEPVADGQADAVPLDDDELDDVTGADAGSAAYPPYL